MLSNRILLRKQTNLVKNTIRFFGGGHHGGDPRKQGHVDLPDQNKNYISNTSDDKFTALTGFNHTQTVDVQITNPYKHIADLPLCHPEQIFSSHAGGHLTYEEEFTHDEPYGYERGEDPFDPTGNGVLPLLLFFCGGALFIHFNFVHFNFFRVKKSEIMMHQRITAGMLEDKIRHYRREGNL
ncbi:unnamed protein product [Moneuplotes crassus]|uniref:Uncharacterized protein n=2 Tax=Euplotes crassus TaxID=5936 RepID=A0AAD1XW49_EUPCR|nr:unnamed protein product [Moneuplotes crassus]